MTISTCLSRGLDKENAARFSFLLSIPAILGAMTLTIKDMVTGEESKTGLPKSNVLYLELTDDAWVCIRPSGTEPKIKFYMGVKGSEREEAETLLENLTNALMNLVKE